MMLRKHLKLSVLFFFTLACLLGSLSEAWAQPCGQDYACHEALVKISSRLSQGEAEQLLRQQGATVLKYFKHSRLYHVALPTGAGTLNQISELRRRPNVLLASPNSRTKAHLLPNDPLFGGLWGLHNTGQLGGAVGNDIGMEEVWELFTDGSAVIVGVIDSGVDYTHPDLAANMWVNPGETAGNGLDDDGNGYVDDVHGYDFANDDGDPMDDDSHGSHVAGTIGAVGNNGVGVTGVNWTVQIMALKFLDENGNGFISDAIEAMEYAIDNGAQVLNNSWGTRFKSDALEVEVNATDVAGLVFVSSAGNEANDNDRGRTNYPSAYSTANILSVLATTRFDSLADFSNYGETTVDLGAPGEDILSTVPTWVAPDDNDYDFFDGTSMASPQVTGAAALLWANFPDLSHREVIDLLLLGVTPKAYLDGLCVSGGVLNLATSVDFAINGLPNRPPVANAGPNKVVEIDQLVSFDGSGSDPDGDSPLFFSWTLQTPGGSSASLDDPSLQKPSFTPDIPGSYIGTLVVNDGEDDSSPDAATVTANLPPEPPPPLPPPEAVIEVQKVVEGGGTVVMEAGENVEVGDELLLDGSGSSTSSTESLLYEWLLITQPADSLAVLGDSTQVVASLSPDVPGTYTIRLNVEDGSGEGFDEVSLLAVEMTLPEDPPENNPDDSNPNDSNPEDSNPSDPNTTNNPSSVPELTSQSSGCALNAAAPQGSISLFWYFLLLGPLSWGMTKL